MFLKIVSKPIPFGHLLTFPLKKYIEMFCFDCRQCIMALWASKTKLDALIYFSLNSITIDSQNKVYLPTNVIGFLTLFSCVPNL